MRVGAKNGIFGSGVYMNNASISVPNNTREVTSLAVLNKLCIVYAMCEVLHAAKYSRIREVNHLSGHVKAAYKGTAMNGDMWDYAIIR